MPLMSGAKFETYAPGALKTPTPLAPSPPNTFARLPCSRSWVANVCASTGFCVGKNTMSASFGTRVTNDEKSVTVFAADIREVVTFRAFRTRSTASARPTE